MLLQELYDFKRLLDSYKGQIVSNLYRIGDNLIILRIKGKQKATKIH